MKLNRARCTTAALSRCMSVPKKIVAPKIRWKAATSLRYCVPPCCMPKASSISARASKLDRLALLADCQRRQEYRNESVLAPRETVGWMTGHLKRELAVAPFMEQLARSGFLDWQSAKNKRTGHEP